MIDDISKSKGPLGCGRAPGCGPARAYNYFSVQKSGQKESHISEVA